MLLGGLALLLGRRRGVGAGRRGVAGGARAGLVVRRRDAELEFDPADALERALNHDPLAVEQIPEVQLRIGVRGADKKAVDRFTRELIPLVLNGPPTATGFGDGRPPVREVVAYWPALVPKDLIKTRVEVVE